MIPFHIPTPQGCNIQTFYGAGGNAGASLRAWNKPPGVSHIYMMLIGGGGDGDGTSGGGSGAVTVWYGAAQHVPDSLILSISRGNGLNTTVFYRTPSGLTNLLEGNGANGVTAGTSTSGGPLTASGFYKSTAGQTGTSGAQSASNSTFLSGGGAGVVTGNYGYTTNVINRNGFFQMQPIIVGVGNAGSGVASQGSAGIGCGGSATGTGGIGMALIASW
jgi:hypothetical protein